MAIAFFCLIYFKASYPAILVITFLINTLSQFYGPSEASAIPLIVKKSQLMVANSLFTITLFSSFLIGFGLAGPLINHLGIDFVFAFGGVLLSLGFILALRFPSIVNKWDFEGKMLVKALRQRDFKSIEGIGLLEIKKTLDLIRGKLLVFFSILILAGVQMVIGVLAVLISSFLEREIHIKATDASYVLIIPLGLGVLTGAYLMNKFLKNTPRRIIVGRGVLAGGLLFFLLGVIPFISPAIKYFPKPRPLHFFSQPPLASVLVVGSFLLGIAMVMIIIPSQTVLQENTPETTRGKVFSVLGVAMQGLSLLPVFLVGLLADFFGSLSIFAGLGVVIFLLGLFALKPNLFFNEQNLPYKFRQFLGLGHWEKE